MYKLIATDLDETLLDHNGSVPKVNVDAIQDADKRGIKTVLATGRGYHHVQNTLKELDLHDKENEYVISFNGGVITENKDNRILFANGLDFDKVKELFENGLNYDIAIHIYTLDGLYIYNMDDEEREYVKNRLDFTPLEKDEIDIIKDKQVIKMIYSNTDKDYIDKIWSELGDIEDDLEVSYSAGRYLELNKKGVTKGTGLKHLAELLDVDIKDTIAIGDNLNDIAMIKEAGLGVGVKSAMPELKEACDYITKNDFDDGAVAEVIEKFTK